MGSSPLFPLLLSRVEALSSSGFVQCLAPGGSDLDIAIIPITVLADVRLSPLSLLLSDGLESPVTEQFNGVASAKFLKLKLTVQMSTNIRSIGYTPQIVSTRGRCGWNEVLGSLGIILEVTPPPKWCSNSSDPGMACGGARKN